MDFPFSMAFFFGGKVGESRFFVEKIRFQLVQNQLFFGGRVGKQMFFFFWGVEKKHIYIYIFFGGGSRKLKEM